MTELSRGRKAVTPDGGDVVPCDDDKMHARERKTGGSQGAMKGEIFVGACCDWSKGAGQEVIIVLKRRNLRGVDVVMKSRRLYSA